MTNSAKIFANITEAKRRMRLASAAGIDLDTASPYHRVHALAVIHKATRSAHEAEITRRVMTARGDPEWLIAAREGVTWWADGDLADPEAWRDESQSESVEIRTGVWVQLRMLARPVEDAALARIYRQVLRLKMLAAERAVDQLRDKKNTDARALWREVWQEVAPEFPKKTAKKRIDEAIADALQRRDISRFAPLYTVWVGIDAVMREWERGEDERALAR